MKRATLPIILALVVAGLLAIFAFGNKPAKAPTSSGEKLPETNYPELARTHIDVGTTTPTPYNSNPPSSGPHYPQPAAWGVVDPAKVEPDERYVHNLEHGGIWIAYSPNLPADQLQQLKDIFKALPPEDKFSEVKAVLTPRAKNDHAISAVAWGWVMNLDTVDAAKLRDFYAEHVNKGPELIP